MKPGWEAGCIDYAENVNEPTHKHTLYCEVIARAMEEDRQTMEIDRTPNEIAAKMIKLASLNPDDGQAREAISQAAHCWVSLSPEWHAGYVRIHSLSVPKDRQGEGYGTAIMRALCTIADTRGWTLTVTPDVTKSITSNPRLVEFYRSFGFRLNRGRKKNFDTQAVMIRD